MTEMQPEAIKAEAAAAAQAEGVDLHARVRDLTLRALRDRAVSLSEVREVVTAVTEGVGVGLGQRAGEIKDAARQALSGLDEALGKSAEATKLAAQQLLSQGKEFKDADLKPALEELKQLEETLLSTVSRVAAQAGGRIKAEFESQVNHARRAGTDTGRLVADTLSEFAGRAGSQAKAGAAEGIEAGLELRKRLTLLASGILGGMADALREQGGAGRK